MLLLMISIMATSLTIGAMATMVIGLTIGHMAIMVTSPTDISGGVAVITGVVMGAVMATVCAGAENTAEVAILVVAGKAGEEFMAEAEAVILAVDDKAGAADTDGANYCCGVRWQLTWTL